MNKDLNLNENLEIKKALKEFEMKNVEQKQQTPSAPINPEIPRMIQWVIKYSGGSVKNEKHALYILLGFVVVVIIITIILSLNGSVKNEKQALYILLGFVVVVIIITIILSLNAFSGPSEAPTGFRGNIPNTPEYQNPPRPEDLR